MRKAAIAIGSNLGDRRAAVAFAAGRLATLIAGLTISDLIETEPAGEGLQDQPLFINAVAVGHTSLSARELEVVALLARGLTNRQIAEMLVISERTATTHVSHILNKLGFSSRSQIAAWAVERGLKTH